MEERVEGGVGSGVKSTKRWGLKEGFEGLMGLGLMLDPLQSGWDARSAPNRVDEEQCTARSATKQTPKGHWQRSSLFTLSPEDQEHHLARPVAASCC